MNYVSRIAVLTGFLTCTGLAFVYLSPAASAQDDEIPPVPPGWVHTGETKHSGLKVYPLKQVTPDLWKHTGEVIYPTAYKIVKKAEPT